jgi:hypothetical protein
LISTLLSRVTGELTSTIFYKEESLDTGEIGGYVASTSGEGKSV